MVRRLLPLIGLAALAACTPPETAQRWRVTVEVETEAGLRTGTGVVETRVRPRNESLYTLDSEQHRVIGQAIAVETPRGLVLALLERAGDFGFFRPADRGYGWVPGPDGAIRRVPIRSGAADPAGRALWRANLARRERWFAERDRALAEQRPLALLEEGWPPFILLEDPADPAGARFLQGSTDAEAAAPGLKVRRIVVQATDEPVTAGLHRRLPWLAAPPLPLSGRQVYPPQSDADLILPDQISTLDAGPDTGPIR